MGGLFASAKGSDASAGQLNTLPKNDKYFAKNVHCRPKTVIRPAPDLLNHHLSPTVMTSTDRLRIACDGSKVSQIGHEVTKKTVLGLRWN